MDIEKIQKILFGAVITVVIFTFAFLVWYLGNNGADCLIDPLKYYKNVSNITNYNCSCFMPLS
jgi:hypothetical protein